MVSVVIIDDHAVVRAGTRELLEGSGSVVVSGEAASWEEGAALVEATAPDVVVMDVHLPGVSGIAATRALASRGSEAAVLVLTAYSDPDYLEEAMAAGARGFVSKTAPVEVLVEAVASLARGGTFVDPALGLELRQRSDRHGDDLHVTEREVEILGLLVQGMTNKAIASRLSISRRTVEGHLSKLFSRLGVSTRTELVRYALERRLVTLGPSG